jgi:hypothetical protein
LPSNRSFAGFCAAAAVVTINRQTAAAQRTVVFVIASTLDLSQSSSEI